MPSIAWFHSDADPIATGELRHMAVPALLVERAGWISRFEPLRRDSAPAEIVVISALALASLSHTALWPTRPVLIVTADDEGFAPGSDQIAMLARLGERIDAVVARMPRVHRWCRDTLNGVRCLFIPDVADRLAELDAAAFRFAARRPAPAVATEHAGEDLFWFAEPGDPVTGAEIGDVLRATADARSRGRPTTLIAPPAILAWLEQAGLDGEVRCLEWKAGESDRRQAAGAQPNLPMLEECDRRRAKVERYRLSPQGPSDRDPARVALAWNDLLQSAARWSRGASERPAVMMFMDLIQDVELALPILNAAGKRDDVRVRVVISAALAADSARLTGELARLGFEPEVHDRRTLGEGAAVSFAGVDALLTIVETTLNVHRRSHSLTLRAQAIGIPTFTLQHGLENVGLTYFDAAHDRTVEIHSDYIFAWFPPDQVPAAVPASIRPRLVHVGRPGTSSHAPQSNPARSARLIAIFENLHWSRYSRRFRERFVEDCFRLARVMDDARIVIRPHPAGRWLTKNRASIEDWPDNIELADEAHPVWAGQPAATLIETADAVITTPSSIAVDAVFGGRRVAVAAYDLDVELYRPLPMLRSFDDWLHFAMPIDESIDDARVRAAFVMRADVPGPSEERILDVIATAVRGFRSAQAPSRHWTSPARSSHPVLP